MDDIEYKNALKYGVWRLQAINNIPSTITAETLGFAIQKINAAGLNNDGTISICPVCKTRKTNEKIGYMVALDAVKGVLWKKQPAQGTNYPVGRFYLIDDKARRIVSAEPTRRELDGLFYWNAKTNDGLDLFDWYPENEIVPAWVASKRNPYISDNLPVVLVAEPNNLPSLTAIDDTGKNAVRIESARRLNDASVFTDWLEPTISRYKMPPLYLLNKREFFDLIQGV